MSSGRETDLQHRYPHISHLRHQSHRHNAARADQQRHLAAKIYRSATLNQGGREPASADASDISQNVDHQKRWSKILDVEFELLTEEQRQQVKIPSPDRIGEKLCDYIRPGLPVRQEL